MIPVAQQASNRWSLCPVNINYEKTPIRVHNCYITWQGSRIHNVQLQSQGMTGVLLPNRTYLYCLCQDISKREGTNSTSSCAAPWKASIIVGMRFQQASSGNGQDGWVQNMEGCERWLFFSFPAFRFGRKLSFWTGFVVFFAVFSFRRVEPYLGIVYTKKHLSFATKPLCKQHSISCRVIFSTQAVCTFDKSLGDPLLHHQPYCIILMKSRLQGANIIVAYGAKKLPLKGSASNGT